MVCSKSGNCSDVEKPKCKLLFSTIIKNGALDLEILENKNGHLHVVIRCLELLNFQNCVEI